jgi:hypothetical protein
MYRKSVLSAVIVAMSMLGGQAWAQDASSVASQSKQGNVITGISKKTGDAKARTLTVVTVNGFRVRLGKARDIKRDSDRATHIYL